MLKKVIIIFFLLSSLSNIKAEVINTIEASGNTRISLETLKVYGDIVIGKDYSTEDFNNILKNLYSTNFFENIELSIVGDTLKINLTEYPVVNSIILSGEDSNNLKKTILSILESKEKESFISNRLVKDVDLIKSVYTAAGYNLAKVEPKIEKFSNNRVNILFDIVKGNRTYIKEINFIGDRKIKSNKLYDIIVSEEKKFWKFLTKNIYFNTANIELDKRLLLNYFKSIGYYDAQILSNNSEIKDNDYTILTYTINAGQRYKVKKISTNIDNVIDKKFFKSLDKIYKDYVGKYYSPFKIQKILEEIDSLISANDLQFVEHSVNELIEGETIEIKINIYEGKKELVEKIIINGNTVTEETVIRSEMLLDEGDPFNKLTLDKSIAKLKSRNLFGEIKTNIKEGTLKDQKIIEILVEEKPTGEISAGAGIGTNGGSFAFEISENNWLGKGINVATSLDVSSETFTGGLAFTNPNYNFSGNSLRFFVENTINDKPDSGFKNNIISSGIGTKFEQYRDIYLSPNLIFSYDDLKVENSASSSLKKQKGAFSDLSFDYSIVNDKRDRVYGPTDGYIASFSQTIPLYADSPYIKNTFSINRYQSFSPNFIGAFKFYGASINGLNNKDVRLSKRLFLSSNRLRGFEAGKIGPKDGIDYVGGNYAASTNFELNLPNLLPESTRTDIGLFLDFGNVWHLDYDDNIDDSNKIRSTTGITTNWQSPVGPMSFILSQNLSKAKTDVTESFNFRLGTTF